MKEIVVRAAVKEDTIAIADVLRNEGLSLPPATNPQLVIDHWERLWDNNPYYKQVDADVFYGWVLEQGDTIVGFFGYLPRLYYLDQKKVTVYIASNWAILKPYRKFAYLLCDAFFNSYPDHLKLTTTAIAATGKIFSMFKGKQFPDPTMNVAFVVPLRTEKLVKTKYPNLSVIFPLLKPFFAVTNFMLPVSFQSRFRRASVRLTQFEIENLPSDFEQFWKRYLQQTMGLLAARDPETMKWVYADVKKEKRKRLFICRSEIDQSIQGYASLIEEPVVLNPEIKRYKIGDLLVLSDLLKKSMITELIRYSLLDGADLLEIHLVGTVSRNDIPYFHTERKTASFPVYYHTQDTQLSMLLSSNKNWILTPYDGDTILG
ncbi:MAG: hypothetical protein GXC73_16865 [Chitinophagaceae bacterium]|nr:hypothetical protein [Chitinophagaceae bacterium]